VARCVATHQFVSNCASRELFKIIRGNHPRLRSRGPRVSDIDQVLKSLSVIIGVLNPVRNRASVAHPNNELLEELEAMLVINAVRSILHYIDARLG